MDEKLIKTEPIGNGREIYVSAHHTFGTDAVLLADFAVAKNGDRVADLGTGCGIIPFLMLRDRRLSDAVGIDISREAAELASSSAELNGFSAFKAVCADIKDLKGKINSGYYTLVTCNPPYKAAGAGIKNSDHTDAVARHEIECTLGDTVKAAARLLQTGGRLCMCHRPERAAELLRIMSENGVEPKRLRLVCKKVGCEPWLVLAEGRRSGKTGLRIMPTLYVYENGGLSDEMKRIYGSYGEGHK